jgi:hypothetical protein
LSHYCLLLLLSFLHLSDLPSGYGGALSVYFGLSAGLQQLFVSHIGLVLRNNAFEKCTVNVSVRSGNSYGGAVSIYMGGYSSSYTGAAVAAAAVGDTVVRNVSVTLDTARFASCSSRRQYVGYGFGANVYGGSFSFYIGAYVWSLSTASSSSSACGATDVMGVDVRVRHVTSVDCSAMSSSDQFYGANVYGGTMSVLYIGAYSFSRSSSDTSISECEATSVSAVSVQVSDSGCYKCSAVSNFKSSAGANSYGGAMSVLYVGTYSFSGSRGGVDDKIHSTSLVSTTQVNMLSIAIKNSSFDDSTALSGKCRLSNHFKCRRANAISNIRSGLRVTGCLREYFNLAAIASFRLQCRYVASCHAPQVYGGTISAIVGPYLRSFMGYGDSYVSCGAVICNKCGLLVENTSIENSLAMSSTSGNLAALLCACAHWTAKHPVYELLYLGDMIYRRLAWSVCKGVFLQCTAHVTTHRCAPGVRRRRVFCRPSALMELE